MVTMTRPDLWRDPGRLLTVDDLADLRPDDDRRYELDDGVLIVSPAPLNIHQLAVARLTAILTARCPDDLVVLPGVGINITRFQHRIPDVAVVQAELLSGEHVEQPPVLAVEVSSRSTRPSCRSRLRSGRPRLSPPDRCLTSAVPHKFPDWVLLTERCCHAASARAVCGSGRGWRSR
jgi:hypothetical protein